MRKLFLCLIPLTLLAVTACDPGPVAIPAVPYVAPAQVEGTVHLEGDSVTWNTYYNGGLHTDYATSASYTPGSKIDYSPWTPEFSPFDRVSQKLEEGGIDKLVWALGLNELAAEGWSLRYQLLWTDLLGQRLPATSCLVMVKPWVANVGTGWINRPPEQTDALRAWIDQFAVDHPNVVVVDWKPILEAHPEYSIEDGVHITFGSGGAEARDAMYREGVSQCA